jgi:hypothetical protein
LENFAAGEIAKLAIMVLLHELPPELLQPIVHYLCAHCGCSGSKSESWTEDHFINDQQHPEQLASSLASRHALCALSRTSKGFYAIAQPTLYHDFALRADPAALWKDEGPWWGGRLASFLETILRRRDLAASVKRVYIHPCLLQYMSGQETSEAFDKIMAALGLEELGDVRKWDYRVPRRGPDKAQLSSLKEKIVGLMLTRLTNLDRLSIARPTFLYNYPLVVSSIALQAAGLKHLPLKRLDVAQFGDYLKRDNGLHVEPVARSIFFFAPSLQTLAIHMCDRFWSPGFRVPQLPNLRELRITNSHLDLEQLKQVLSACAGRLESFTYEAAFPADVGCIQSGMSTNHFHAADAAALLAPHRATLRSLRLDLRAIAGPGARMRVLRRLGGFARLEDLRVDVQSVFPDPRAREVFEPSLVELLPRTIRTFGLVGDVRMARVEDRVVVCLQKLAGAVRRGTFPGLRRIMHDVAADLDSDDDGLPGMFAACGVAFGYVAMPLTKGILPVKSQMADDGWDEQDSLQLPLSSDDDDDL